MGASSSTPVAPTPAPAPLPLPPQPLDNPIPSMPLNHAPRNSEMIEKLLLDAKPHRCASRMDDFAMSMFNLNWSETPSRFTLLSRCMRSEMGLEPRDPHTSLPADRLPRWDPRHASYDPQAPFNSFPRKLKDYPVGQ